jgi:hypothetical protein
MSRGIAVGIAIDYGLDDRGIEVRIPAGSTNFTYLYRPTGSGAHLASFPMGTGALSHGVRRQGREADHQPTTSAEVKKTWIGIWGGYVFKE